MKNPDPLCKICIFTEMSKSELIGCVSNLINGQVYVRSIISNIIEVDIFTNEDFDREKLYNEDGFVYYPFYLEIQPSKVNIDISIYIDEISSLLQNLWNDYNDAVVACDFEDKLPKNKIEREPTSYD